MSTTADLKVAIKFTQLEQSANPNRSGSALLFRVLVSNMMQRGADLAYLSVSPNEKEYLYPPLSYLQPTGRRETISLTATGDTINVVEVRPRFAS